MELTATPIQDETLCKETKDAEETVVSPEKNKHVKSEKFPLWNKIKCCTTANTKLKTNHQLKKICLSKIK